MFNIFKKKEKITENKTEQILCITAEEAKRIVKEEGLKHKKEMKEEKEMIKNKYLTNYLQPTINYIDNEIRETSLNGNSLTWINLNKIITKTNNESIIYCRTWHWADPCFEYLTEKIISIYTERGFKCFVNIDPTFLVIDWREEEN